MSKLEELIAFHSAGRANVIYESIIPRILVLRVTVTSSPAK